jgi:Tat protein secretion system quality control protein TatD with DNase activity
LKYVADKLSQVKETGTQEVADITTANAKKIFGT